MSEQNGKKKKRFAWDAVWIGGMIFTALALILYGSTKALEYRGYMLMPTSVKYWFRLMLIMGIVFLLAKLISVLPKRESSAKTAKVCAVILCVTTAFLMYWQTLGYVQMDFHEKMELSSPNDGRKYAVMEMDYAPVGQTEDEDAIHYRFLRVYPKRSRLFYDCSRYLGEDSLPTMLVTDTEAVVKYQWEDGVLRLYQEGGTARVDPTLSEGIQDHLDYPCE